ncbi:transposase [Catellatospora coxensis]|uniref:Transposase IS204/IS1001/IS1096/IS1165 DDE domain-containing protein n=1 Tax=Catellatospora coxensis TaxID=310354 RepID=A0A8J3L2G5_9ACTN|nr:transposase [Catellatospora coxensis]GIG06490.1 hypothetical protein Cco03nite_31900 [Catellatospora coxensis]
MDEIAYRKAASSSPSSPITTAASLSNSLAEGINAGIRLIQHRAHGYARLDNFTEMIYLCHGGIPACLPTT